MPRLTTANHALMGRHGDVVRDLARNGQNIGFVDQLPVDEMARPGQERTPLPPDASNTLYVEGLPPDSTRREVARILFLFNYANEELLLFLFFQFYLYLNII